MQLHFGSKKFMWHVPKYEFEYFPIAKDIYGEDATINIISPVANVNEGGIIERGIEDNTISGYAANAVRNEFNHPFVDENGVAVTLTGDNYSEGLSTSDSNPNNYNTHPIPWLMWDANQRRLHGTPQEIDEDQTFDVIFEISDNDAYRGPTTLTEQITILIDITEPEPETDQQPEPEPE